MIDEAAEIDPDDLQRLRAWAGGSISWIGAARDADSAARRSPADRTLARPSVRTRFMFFGGLAEVLPKPASIGPVPQRSDLTVLVAEDNKVNQTVIATMLRNFGHRVVTVESGSAALDALRTTSFDLVLMDLQMPEMDGEEATQIIRKDTSYCDLPIIALTAHAFAGVRERLLGQGFSDYLPKPISRDQLIEVITRWCPDTTPETKP